MHLMWHLNISRPLLKRILFTVLDRELSVVFLTKGMTNTRKPLQFGFRISELVFQ